MDFDNYLKNIEEEMNKHKRQMDSYLNDLIPNRTAPETRFCPYCGHDLEVSMTFCPYCGADLAELESNTNEQEIEPSHSQQSPQQCEQATPNKHSYNLTHYPELEEESQAKIGTFEFLYGHYSTEAYGVDFNTKDYAPLVNALAAVVEIEANLSIYQLLRALHGVDLRSMFDKDCRGAISINRDNIKIELSDKRQMLGGLCFCARIFKSELQRYIPEIDKIAHILPLINSIRRDASHGGVVDNCTFERFLNKGFITFYEVLLPHLLKLKNDLRSGKIEIRNTYSTDKYSDRKGTENIQRMSYVRYEGYADRDYLNSIQGIFDDIETKNDDTEKNTSPTKKTNIHDGRMYSSGEALDNWGEICNGVILTNSEKLSLKYNQGINVHGDEGLMTYVHNITNPILQYIEFSKAGGNNYVLMDMSSPEYACYIKKECTWQKHLEALEDFAQENGISNKNPWALFIIGGDDVIPMPKVENPTNIFNRRDKVDALEADVDTDVPYAFTNDEIEIGEMGEIKYDTLLHRTAGPRFVVGRLPMETGLMETDFSNKYGTGDFDIYTKKMLSRYLHVDVEKMQQEKPAGLNVSKAMCTVAERFFNHAQVSIKELPVLCNGNEGGLANNGYFVSPILDVLSQDSSYNKPYIDRIQQADILVYVTHGCASNSDIGAGFFGDSINGDCQPIVLTPELIRTTSASVLAPVCCWGARFINYRRERSMLLTTMYESRILTFLGSSRSAPAAPENTFGGAEGLQNIFVHYIMQGLPVAESMVRAKYDMLHTMTDPTVQSLPNLLCFVEFNLFGDPLLRANATEKRHCIADDIRTSDMKAIDISLIDKDMQTIAEEYNKRDGYSNYDCYDKKDSILERVRNMVNNNLADIRKIVDKHLYEEYGVEPRTLATIHKMSTHEGEPIRIFRYSNTENIVHKHTIAFVNENGTIRSVIQTI